MSGRNEDNKKDEQLEGFKCRISIAAFGWHDVTRALTHMDHPEREKTAHSVTRSGLGLLSVFAEKSSSLRPHGVLRRN